MKIKICGLFRECDIDYVNRACPDYIGFVFAKSKRRVTMEQAATLKQRLSNQIQAVGVFVNEEYTIINEAVKRKVIDMVQLHGDEDAEYIKRIEAPVIKTVKIGDNIPQNAAYILFDNAIAGSGKTFDWSLLPQTDKPYFLAGGINISNIQQAMETVNPFAVDISSGVETDGLKDSYKILEIVRTVRNG